MDTITTILYILGGLLLLLLVVATFVYLLYLYVNSSSVTPGTKSQLTDSNDLCTFYPFDQSKPNGDGEFIPGCIPDLQVCYNCNPPNNRVN